jgi:hypothetical protein
MVEAIPVRKQIASQESGIINATHYWEIILLPSCLLVVLDKDLSLQHVYRYLRFAHYRSSINAELQGSVEQSEPGGKESKASLASSSFRLKALLPRVETLRQDWSNIYGWLVSNYTPDLYPGKITFFWTSEEPWRSDAWQKVVKAKEGEVETYINPGNHISSRTEYLPVLAQRLRECLNKAQAN